MKLLIVISIIIIAALIVVIMLLRRRTHKINPGRARDVIPVVLPEYSSKVEIFVLRKLQYANKVHPSAGLDYIVKCDENVFNLSYSNIYDDPLGMESGKSGADAALRFCTITALKRGTYPLSITLKKPGEPDQVVSYTIWVR